MILFFSNLKGRIVVALYTYQGSEFGDMSFNKVTEFAEKSEYLNHFLEYGIS